MNNVVLVGLGPHAKRIYYPLIEKYQRKLDIHLSALIELNSSKEDVKEYLQGKIVKPENIFFLQNCLLNSLDENLDEEVESKLNQLLEEGKLDGLIISTEPKAHKAYAEWALRNNVNILMDKPITAPINASSEVHSATQIYRDYVFLRNLQGHSKSKFYIVCQRRNHEGYLKVKDLLEEFISEYSIPISFVDIYHSDGTWNLPHEFEKENHPYKYGYGKMLHSGYHSVDLLAWLIELNGRIKDKEPDSVYLNTLTFKPSDFFAQINNADYKKLFPGYNQAFEDKSNFDKYKDYGELDIFLQLQLSRKGKVLTTSTVNLQQNSFSRRAWVPLPKDTYKGNGRLRHERIHLQVSHLLNIQVHSYQSYQAGEKDIELEGAGNEDHFDIYIFRNSGVVGGLPFEKIKIGEEMRSTHGNGSGYLGHNEQGREKIFLNFLKGADDNSEFYKHELTNKLISKTYESLAHSKDHSKGSIGFKINQHA